MSNGGGESGKELEHNSHSKKKSKHDDFFHGIAKISVAQVCESTGFQGFQQSALDTLSDIAVRYISQIGKTANSNANLAGRTECNVLDIIQGLEELGMLQGFSGASEINRCLAGSGAIREISQYVDLSEEIPFAYSIPQFPITKERKLKPSFVQSGQTPPGEHIPLWLSAFPDPGTYTCFNSGNDGEGDGGMDKIDPVKEYRKAEGSVLNMQQLSTSNGLIIDRVDASGSKRAAADSNPFLASPLQIGGKEVAPVVLPMKLSDEDVVQFPADGENHVSVIKAFAPAIDQVKSRASDSDEATKKVLLNSRSTIKFKLGTGKKLGCSTMRQKDEKMVKFTSSAGNDNLKDDRKRRAEQILKEAMESAPDQAQL